VAKRKIDPSEWQQAREASRQFREMAERRLARLAAWDEAERRRKERLRRWTFGLLGREEQVSG
jgi:hypothetical protein